MQVGSDDDWSAAEYWSYGPVAGGDTTVHYAGPTAQSGNTYHWRVRVFAGGAWRDWVPPPGHMNAGPPAPLPSSPVGDAIAFQNGPELRTNSALDPENDVCTYDFEVYADSALTTLVASASGVPQGGSTTSWTVDVQLPEQGRAWWRVRASDGYFRSSWSGASSFFVDGINEPPTAPLLSDPLDSAVMFATDLSLRWSGATDPDLVDTFRYRVRVDTPASLATATVYDSLDSQLLYRGRCARAGAALPLGRHGVRQGRTGSVLGPGCSAICWRAMSRATAR